MADQGYNLDGHDAKSMNAKTWSADMQVRIP